MSGVTRPLRADEVARFWPAVRSARLMGSLAELQAFRDAAPWRVRASDRGDVLLLSRWRAHLDVLAIRGLWAPSERVGSLVSDARAVARSQGFDSVLSPVLAESAAVPYLLSEMTPVARLVAFTAPSGTLRANEDPGSEIRVRTAASTDAGALAELDALCFEEFWHNGHAEVSDDLAAAHVAVAESSGGALLGYASGFLRGSSATLGRLAVAPPERRRGVARALVAAIGAWAQSSGALGVSLCTQEDNVTSQESYRALGFEEVEERYLLLQREV